MLRSGEAFNVRIDLDLLADSISPIKILACLNVARKDIAAWISSGKNLRPAIREPRQPRDHEEYVTTRSDDVIGFIPRRLVEPRRRPAIPWLTPATAARIINGERQWARHHSEPQILGKVAVTPRRFNATNPRELGRRESGSPRLSNFANGKRPARRHKRSGRGSRRDNYQQHNRRKAHLPKTFSHALSAIARRHDICLALPWQISESYCSLPSQRNANSELNPPTDSPARRDFKLSVASAYTS